MTVRHPWFGPLPDNFRVGALKFAFQKIASGGTPDTSCQAYWAGDRGTPWVAIADMSSTPAVTETAKRVTDKGIQDKRLTVFPIGTLLYSMYASVGHVAKLELPATVNQAILTLAPKSGFNPRYAFWQLVAMRAFVLAETRTGTQNNLNADTIKNFPFIYPPEATQSTIGDYLDHEAAAIDELIVKKAQLVKELRSYQESAIAEAVRPRANWRVVKIKRIVNALPKSVRPAADTAEEGLVPFYVSGEQVKTCTLADHKDAEAIILATGGSPAVHLAAGSFSFSTDCWALKGKDDAYTPFLYWLLSSMRHDIDGLGFVGVGIKHLDKEWLLNRAVMLPSPAEQAAIATELADRTSATERLIWNAEAQIAELRKLRSTIIVEAVAGKRKLAA